MSKRYETRSYTPIKLDHDEIDQLLMWRRSFRSGQIGGPTDSSRENYSSDFDDRFGDIVSEILNPFVPKTLTRIDPIMLARKAARNARISNTPKDSEKKIGRKIYRPKEQLEERLAGKYKMRYGLDETDEIRTSPETGSIRFDDQS